MLVGAKWKLFQLGSQNLEAETSEVGGAGSNNHRELYLHYLVSIPALATTYSFWNGIYKSYSSLGDIKFHDQ